MKIGQKFNKLTVKEYYFYIDNHKKYTDFNTLGLYRSIIENDKLSTADKVEVREYAHKIFRKSFDFLQLKDPETYFDIITIGQELTVADSNQIWKEIKDNQQKILADKRIRHRNFGTYSKHICGHDNCHLNGVMIKQGSGLSYGCMHFKSDKNKNVIRYKSDKRKADRKSEKQIIQEIISNDESIKLE